MPPPGYLQRVREICDRHGVLLVSDEVICAYGRLGHMFGCERYGYQPDIITSAKGLTSGYAPLGAAIVSDRLMEPFLEDRAMFSHGRFRDTLTALADIPIVGDIRGEGYFWAIELVKDRETKATFDDDEAERLLRGYLSPALFDAGLICRADDRGEPVLQFSPPLIAGPAEFEFLGTVLYDVLTEASRRARG